MRRFPRDVEIDWETAARQPATKALAELCVAPVERDAVASDRWSRRRWFELARGSRRGSSLAWTVAQLGDLATAREVLDRLYDSFRVFVSWRLRDPAATRTFSRFPVRRRFFHRRLLGGVPAVRDVVRQPLPPPWRLTRPAARALIDVVRVTLGVRHRETDPVTYANPRDVTLFSLGRGVDVALFGMVPERRLPLESYLGFVAAKNGVPIAYGGAWVFLDRARIGINVFDAFRGGESGYLFAQILRVYARHLGVRRFVVEPFQFGRRNEEGIRSGAFWFYYRLGFRPVDPSRARLADAEWRRLVAHPGVRSAPSTLRRLAAGNLALDVDRDGPGPDGVPDLARIGLAVTRFVGQAWRGNRRTAEAAALGRVIRRLGVRGVQDWPPGERDGFQRLSLVVGLIPDLAGWPPRDKAALARLMRARGAARERAFAIRLPRHPRFCDALRSMAWEGDRVATALAARIRGGVGARPRQPVPAPAAGGAVRLSRL